MKNFRKIMNVVAITIMIAIAMLVTHNVVANGTSHDELVIID